jgi:hypothetical protein
VKTRRGASVFENSKNRCGRIIREKKRPRNWVSRSRNWLSRSRNWVSRSRNRISRCVLGRYAKCSFRVHLRKRCFSFVWTRLYINKCVLRFSICQEHELCPFLIAKTLNFQFVMKNRRKFRGKGCRLGG